MPTGLAEPSPRPMTSAWSRPVTARRGGGPEKWLPAPRQDRNAGRSTGRRCSSVDAAATMLLAPWCAIGQPLVIPLRNQRPCDPLALCNLYVGIFWPLDADDERRDSGIHIRGIAKE